MSYVPLLGPYQAVTIDGTARYSTALTPGWYAAETEGSPAHVNLQNDNTTPATTSKQRIASGGGRYFRVPPDGLTYYLAVIRSGSGSGVLHINKVG